jgi:aminomethyltransferase
MQAEPATSIRVGLLFDGKRAAREGAAVVRPGDETATVGAVTSGSFCPTLGSAAAMALVDPSVSMEGTPLEVLIRDTPCPARVVPLPFYRRGAPRI